MKIRNSSKIDVRDIIVDHYKTLANANSKKADDSDIIIFFILPAVIATALLLLGANLEEGMIGNVISGLSIFVGLLLNVLVLIFDLVKKDSKSSIKNELLKQSLANISFTILLSLFCIITSIVTLVKYDIIKLSSMWLTYFLLMEFVACLLMIIKRMYRLLMNEFKEITSTANTNVKEEIM